DRAPGAGRRSAHRAAPLDRPSLPVRRVQKFRTWLRGHRHAAQGRTVHTGLPVITGTEDRQHAYVALTRGTDANHAYVFTASPQTRRPRARPPPGSRTGPL